jgi:hypothetical protein
VIGSPRAVVRPVSSQSTPDPGSATLAGMTEPTEEPGVDPPEETASEAPEASASAQALDSEGLDAAARVPPSGRRRARRRVPGLIVAALLVGAGVFIALRGMQQVVARAPATPVPAAISTPAPTSNQGPPSPTPQPTPMPTSSALILEP